MTRQKKFSGSDSQGHLSLDPSKTASSSQSSSRKLTSYLQDFRASLSRLQDEGSAPKTTVISGRKLLKSFPKSSPMLSFSKTLLESESWVSTVSSLNWRTLLTPSLRGLFQLEASANRSGGIDAGFLPSPTRSVRNGTLQEYGGSNNPYRGSEDSKQYLSPSLVEWMMGFPEGWTDFGCSATASSQQSHTNFLRPSSMAPQFPPLHMGEGHKGNTATCSSRVPVKYQRKQ